MGQVVYMNEVAPKRVDRTYKGQKVIVTFIPGVRTWKWEIRYTQVVSYSDEAKTLQDALKAAYKMIDKLERK